MCENTGDLILCEGQCCGSFHPRCAGLSEPLQRRFVCQECSSGKAVPFSLIQNAFVKYGLNAIGPSGFHLICVLSDMQSTHLNSHLASRMAVLCFYSFISVSIGLMECLVRMPFSAVFISYQMCLKTH